MKQEWLDTERTVAARQPGQPGLAVALLVSAVLHGGLAGGILWLSMSQDRHSSPAPTVTSPISIALLRPAAQPATAALPDSASVTAPEPVPAVTSAAMPESASEIAAAAMPEPGQGLAPNSETSVRPAVTEVRPAPAAPATTPQPTQSVPGTVPSLLTLRQAVRQLSSGPGELTGQLDCSAEQLRNRLLNCDRGDPQDAELAASPRLILSFNQTDSAGQGAAVSASVDANLRQLQDGLSAAGLDAVTSGYLQQELLQGIEVYRATGNTRLQRLEQQAYRNDAAYQQAQRVMNPR